ncbi:DUF3842 family protein [Desulfotomaculum copahuensis]|uniref:DUF3842 domain-containing protein n=1 Tax=Desulfotomaculum copahuensis TaxID=1838280 RepID=A0A1B7LDY9_9FIRM|nr:DUF3842 family protein [Desulfotomaculum copahuensis]OAT81317.1 hypothetical protein A6M21_00530 [Desulfotomaculum copahuensis]
MRIAVIDGQGGGIGKVMVEKLRLSLAREDVEIIALGTNALASALMLKAGANEAASGENAIIYNAGRVDIIIGTIAVLIAHSMLGEFTPAMAAAVAASPAKKVLLHLNRANVEVVGVVDEPLPHLVDQLVERVRVLVEGKKNHRIPLWGGH